MGQRALSSFLKEAFIGFGRKRVHYSWGAGGGGVFLPMAFAVYFDSSCTNWQLLQCSNFMKVIFIINLLRRQQ